jgi:hypothetical protein
MKLEKQKSQREKKPLNLKEICEMVCSKSSNFVN